MPIWQSTANPEPIFQYMTNSTIINQFSKPMTIFKHPPNSMSIKYQYNANIWPICQIWTNPPICSQNANPIPIPYQSANSMLILHQYANPSPIHQYWTYLPIFDQSFNLLTYISIHRQLASVFPCSSNPASTHGRPSIGYLKQPIHKSMKTGLSPIGSTLTRIGTYDVNPMSIGGQLSY